MYLFSEQLIDLLEIKTTCSEAAEGFSTILTDTGDILSKSSNANIKMMYKQRLYVENCDKILKKYEQTNQGNTFFMFNIIDVLHTVMYIPLLLCIFTKYSTK